MVKKILTFAAVMAFSMVPISALGATDNRVTNVSNVRADDFLTKDDAPALIIESTQDHSENFSFMLNLNGAEWTYNDSGYITEGVHYTKYTSTMLKVSVDLSKFDARNNNLRIPLLCQIKDGGNISVSVDGSESTVSSGTYIFATYIDGEISFYTKDVINITNSQKKGTLNDIELKDSTSFLYKKGEKIGLKLSNGFRFVNDVEPTTSGKFSDVVDFYIDADNASQAYLFFTGNSGKDSGKVILSGLEIEPINNGTYGSVKLTVTVGEKNASISVAEYIKEISTQKKIVINDLNPEMNRPVITGTGGADGNIAVKVDGKDIGQTRVDEDGKWSILYPEKMDALTDGEHLISVGYYNNSYKPAMTLINEAQMQFTIKTEKPLRRIVIPINKNYFTINGEKLDTDIPAFVDGNNRTLIPIRMFATAMGITDQSWDAAAETAKFSDGNGKTVSVTSGRSAILVNGVSQPMDTEATIKNGRMMVPMRELMTAFGITDSSITWDASTQTITILSK